MAEKKNLTRNRHIAYICDKNYLLPTKVSIQSLIENINIAESIHYLIHVITFASADQSWQQLYEMQTRNVGIQIHYLNYQEYKERFDKIFQKTYVTTTALLKFELQNILFDIDQVLYLDSDVIVNQSLDSIFEYDISQYALAAVFDLVFYRARLTDSNSDVDPSNFYFNSGVMLLNLKEFRRRKVSDLLWEAKLSLLDSPRNVMNLMDQNVFNEVLSSDCLPLPIRYNCPNHNLVNKDFDFGQINHLYGTNYKDNVDLWQDAVIIHYIGRRSKPWLYEKCGCREIWDRYCKHAGISIMDLDRPAGETKEGRIHCYIHYTMDSLRAKGLKETWRYILYRMSLKMGRK